MPSLATVAPRRAIEAVRSGVPNRDAVRALGCDQPAAERRFKEQLATVSVGAKEGRQAHGFLVEGRFGTGKSHLLEYLQHVALTERFVCSRVVISKETPLYDPHKVFLAAMESAIVPGLQGQAVQEIAHKLNTRSQAHADLYRWANSPQSGLAPMFPATLLVHERLNNDPELVEEVTNFWAGQKLSIQRIRQGLKLIGASDSFHIRAVPLRSLAPQRFAFVTRLMMAVGFAGWVILFDEVELVGRYSLLQRGRSYAEIARWLGRSETQQVPGLTAVLAITDDFAPVILDEKGDKFTVGPRLRDKGGDYEAMAARAELGMRAIEREAVTLEMPGADVLAGTYQKLRDIYRSAYSWEPPKQPLLASPDKSMRVHVRRWINEWDIQRIYHAEPETEVEQIATDYSEDQELEKEREQSDSDSSAGEDRI
jgi:hypothetical protein